MKVLYSHEQESWKLTDFGTAAEGTSKRECTTGFRRGTEGYRAPEVIRDVRPVYNNKSDIWGLGCILYELVTKEKAFASDWRVHQFAESGREFVMFKEGVLKMIKNPTAKSFRTLTGVILTTNYRNRPSAASLAKSFRKYAQQSFRLDAEVEERLGEYLGVELANSVESVLT